MASSVTKVSPLKLPKAPKGYDEADQDRTRRLIESAFVNLSLGLQGVSLRLPRATLPQDWVHVSPIVGQVIGDPNNGALSELQQLLNPANSGRYVIVYHCEALVGLTSTAADFRWRITSEPIGMGSAQPQLLMRLNENDPTTIKALLRGREATAFPLVQSHWLGGNPTASSSATQYRRPSIVSVDEAPIVLAPGQAIELTNGMVAAGGSAVYVGMYVMFDEVDVGGAFPNVTLNETWRPASSIVGAVKAVAGNLATVQLLNPIYSPKNLRVTHFRMWGAGSSARYRARKTRTPLHMSANPVLGPSRHVDDRNTDAIYGIVQSTTQPLEGTGAQWTEADSFWFDVPGSISSIGRVQTVIHPRSFPMILKPGSAIELQAADTFGSAYGIFVWDEVEIV